MVSIFLRRSQVSMRTTRGARVFVFRSCVARFWRYCAAIALVLCGATAVATAAETIEVVDLVLEQVEGEALLVFKTTGPPSFRERVVEGGLVIELRNAVAAPAIGDLVPPSGVVESVLVKETTAESSGEEVPALEFQIQARGPHTAGASYGGGEPGIGFLQVRVLRRGQAPILGEVSRAEIASSALAPEQGAALVDLSPEAAARMAASRQGSAVSQPLVGDTPERMGKRLELIEEVTLAAQAGSDDFFALRGDGPFAYETLRLDDPPRLVLDLDGVINDARAVRSTSGQIVNGVRIAQYRAQPDPVTRVVFDLREAAIPLIERQQDGLDVRLVPQARVDSLSEVEIMAAPSAPAVPVSTSAEPVRSTAAPPEPAPLPEATRRAISLVNRYGEALRTGDRTALQALLAASAELWQVRDGEAQRVAKGRARVARTLVEGAEGVDFGGMIAGRRLVGLLRQGAPDAGELDLLEVEDGLVARVWLY